MLLNFVEISNFLPKLMILHHMMLQLWFLEIYHMTHDILLFLTSYIALYF